MENEICNIMDETVEQSLKEIGHSISCLHINSGAQLDDIFRLRHLFPYSKFVNDMRGLSINLGNFFSAYAPRLDSFLVGPIKPPVSETTVSYADKIIVADLLNVGKSDETINRWKQLKKDLNNSSDALVHKDNVTAIVEANNELLQQLVNRSLEFEKPQKHSEANTFLKLGTSTITCRNSSKNAYCRLHNKNKMSLPDWKGLLKWTLQQVPETPSSEKKPISKEDVEFLQKAMESVHDHDKKVKSAAQLIQELATQSKFNDLETLLEAFDTMEQFYEEHPGNASSVHRTGMLDAITEYIKQGNLDVMPAVLSLLITTISNNAKVQEEAAKGPMMQYLLQLRQKADGTALEPKLITAIAAVIRHCDIAEKQFVKVGGMQYIAQCTAKKNLKVKEKAALLIYHFVNQQKLDKREAQKMQLLTAVRNLMPLDVQTHGIQYAEVCINLFAAAVLKYPHSINRDEALSLWRQLAKAVENTKELEGANEILREVHNALVK
ncbi:uncharacterized protein BXIN_1196 [Babesia sp. Xinjiang]|uniref:uncharacterized protein n=1 Tax=Babesia sp. Xinjiang TaxID=462227 RepID=UPI000A237D98|nr:uncharacterized protein BXIN_1196 [Babesia sp. Xinjiang]ORM40057.1 hypothetical protein BXIN_1196 [Babesia sp. Xinjiang]